jgi:hypothetical protein
MPCESRTNGVGTAGTHPTTHRYLNPLEAGCLVTRVRPFTASSIEKWEKNRPTEPYRKRLVEFVGFDPEAGT